jgi:hypothetical protein
VARFRIVRSGTWLSLRLEDGLGYETVCDRLDGADVQYHVNVFAESVGADEREARGRGASSGG